MQGERKRSELWAVFFYFVFHSLGIAKFHSQNSMKNGQIYFELINSAVNTFQHIADEFMHLKTMIYLKLVHINTISKNVNI